MGDQLRGEVQEAILSGIEDGSSINSEDLAKQHGWDHVSVVTPAIIGLQATEIVNAEVVSKAHFKLTTNGEALLKDGSPEFLLYNAVDATAGTPKDQAMKLPFGQAGFSEAMKNKWLSLDKASGNLIRSSNTEIKDNVRLKIQALKDSNMALELEKNEVIIFKRRKLIEESTVKYFVITKGPKYVRKLVKKALDITAEMIQNGSWKNLEFKELNYNSLGVVPVCGHLHPLLKVRAAFREIFLEMGFEEMPANQFVESSFWNFDTLFQPQQHPARDAHDTFFIADPAQLSSYPEDYLNRVKEMHEKGGSGSIGWRYDWSLDEAKKNILRTHTTGVSSKMLYKLAQQEGGFKPKKYFSIDRVYRNETVDATHLAEFHQIEGVVADYGLTLADLIGVIAQFFHKWGMTQVKFKPAYNPYTEPSMEIFGYHNQLKRWVEIGNSGMFRPEMLLPMGLPEGVKVLGWGLSLERPTMIRYAVEHIKDLCGHSVDLRFIEKNTICDIQLDDKSQ
eukprot:TRINITY_DN5458_c0_g1_i2.p1 TRINITY_DN5458_c0_g1~~TRINITY_DN5458_c0_g1_i2.p1  ORF type:complete len:506 (-),score=113.41 TRINITY_DN5458_c0_g1_i2:35-1552(-)